MDIILSHSDYMWGLGNPGNQGQSGAIRDNMDNGNLDYIVSCCLVENLNKKIAPIFMGLNYLIYFFFCRFLCLYTFPQTEQTLRNQNLFSSLVFSVTPQQSCFILDTSYSIKLKRIARHPWQASPFKTTSLKRSRFPRLPCSPFPSPVQLSLS